MSGTDILEFRKRLGLSQVELAEQLGVSQPAVAQWEAGVTTPRGSVVKLIEFLKKTSKTRVDK